MFEDALKQQLLARNLTVKGYKPLLSAHKEEVDFYKKTLKKLEGELEALSEKLHPRERHRLSRNSARAVRATNIRNGYTKVFTSIGRASQSISVPRSTISLALQENRAIYDEWKFEYESDEKPNT